MMPKQKIGPSSRIFARGAIGQLDGRSTEARFLKSVEGELLDHIGPRPTITQRMLVSKTARIMLRLELLEQKELSGNVLSDRDGRVCGALYNQMRLCFRELGLKQQNATPKAPSLQDIAAKHRAEPAK
jgi:hypothetical protein